MNGPMSLNLASPPTSARHASGVFRPPAAAGRPGRGRLGACFVLVWFAALAAGLGAGGSGGGPLPAAAQQPPPTAGPGTPPPGGARPGGPRGVCPSKGAPQTVARSGAGGYAPAPAVQPDGFLSSGQGASVLLSGIDFDDSGGPLLFNHPAGLASEGSALALADRNNNRVLIWKQPPDADTPPDLVLGQTDFRRIAPGKGLANMNWPSALSLGGGRLAVADTENHRLLLWNALPQQSGQAADTAIDLVAMRSRVTPPRNLMWPWGVWTDGQRLVVAATHGASLLIWNQWPTAPDTLPDLVVQDSRMGTPRHISSNGEWLAVWDHNAKLGGAQGDGRGTFLYRSFPTRADQQADLLLPFQAVGLGLEGGGFLGLGDGLFRYDVLPSSAEQRPDWSSSASAIGSQDGLGIALVDGRLYLLDGNGNKLVVYKERPQGPDQAPDFVIGAPELCANSLDLNHIFSNPVPATDGRHLFVSSDFDAKLYVWNQIPDQNNAAPDWIYDLDMAPWDNALWGRTFVLAGKTTVEVWEDLPLDGRLPDRRYLGGIGSVRFQDLSGVAMDDRYFYLSDQQAGRIYVWEGLPEADEDPVYTLETGPAVARLNSDGTYLAAVVNAGGGAPVRLWEVAKIAAGAAPLEVRKGSAIEMNLPGSAMTVDGRLLVADTVWSRILGWDSVAAAVRGERPSLLLGATQLTDHVPELGRDTLFWPATMALGGGYFWVGEFKFSMRLLRFDLPSGGPLPTASASPPPAEPTPTTVVPRPAGRVWLPLLRRTR